MYGNCIINKTECSIRNVECNKKNFEFISKIVI